MYIIPLLLFDRDNKELYFCNVFWSKRTNSSRDFSICFFVQHLVSEDS